MLGRSDEGDPAPYAFDMVVECDGCPVLRKSGSQEPRAEPAPGWLADDRAAALDPVDDDWRSHPGATSAKPFPSALKAPRAWSHSWRARAAAARGYRHPEPARTAAGPERSNRSRSNGSQDLGDEHRQDRRTRLRSRTDTPQNARARRGGLRGGPGTPARTWRCAQSVLRSPSPSRARSSPDAAFRPP